MHRPLRGLDKLSVARFSALSYASVKVLHSKFAAYDGVKLLGKSMIPSKYQWKKWSLPSKYSAIGLLLAFVSMGVAIYDHLPSLEINKLEAYVENTKASSVDTSDITVAGSTSETLNTYKRDGKVKYAHLDLSSFPELVSFLRAVNDTRLEYPRRAVDIELLQDYLDSGNIRMTEFLAKEIVTKQTNLEHLRK
ncbi:hypothetical protein MAH1_31870 [Sessilibacter sp. MAH1]